MVQFKDYFLHPDRAPYTHAASVQKCLRAGGKHNDLDSVGLTPRHHTFFEMLGTFSFGHHDKRAAIKESLDFLVNVVKIPPDQLTIT